MEAIDYRLINNKLLDNKLLDNKLLDNKLLDNKKDFLIDSSVNIFKALGDETRLRIMNALLEKPLTVTGIVANTNVSQSCVSHQLKFLKQLRLVKSERKGKYIVYSLDDEHIIDIITVTYEHVKEEIDDHEWKR